MKEIEYIAELSGSLRLTKNGEWYHNGDIFQNKKLSDLFLRSIVWDQKESRYYIEIGNQRATFTHEGCVYFATALDDSAVPWLLSLTNGEKIQLDPATLRLEPDDAIACTMHAIHPVRLLRSAHQRFATHVIDEHTVEIGGKQFPLREKP